MVERIHRLVGYVSVVGMMLVSALPAGAEPSAPSAEPSVTTETPAPTEEDVARMIHELGSLRDFERLHWILTAAEQQVPPVRAELLKQLDEQVQELVRNEVELRTATALTGLNASLQHMKSTESELPDHARVEQRPQRVETVQEQASLPEPMPDNPRSYAEVKDEIVHTEFATEPRASMGQFRQLSRAIMAVPDAQQREELRNLIYERQREAAKQQLKARKAEAEAYFSSFY